MNDDRYACIRNLPFIQQGSIFFNKKKLNDTYFLYIILNNDIFCIILLFEKMLYRTYGTSRINL